jgi:hypothetical protein
LFVLILYLAVDGSFFVEGWTGFLISYFWLVPDVDRFGDFLLLLLDGLLDFSFILLAVAVFPLLVLLRILSVPRLRMRRAGGGDGLHF